jgi:hypothetical protein
MTPTEVKQAISLCRDAKIPLMIWGHHGMSKSSIVKQVAEEKSIGFVDFRCSQIESSDLRGFPTRRKLGDDEVTVYCPPAELPREGEGILFLDEINRADDPVIQAAFQIIVERKLGTYNLPDGWQIVTACNYATGYQVNSMCNAFVGRFCHIEMTNSEKFVQEWADYIMEKHEDESALKVIAFMGQENNNICSKKEGTIDFDIEPSPRLWEMAIRVQTAANKYPKHIVHMVMCGLIGHELTIAYEKSIFTVSPKDIVEKGMDANMEELTKATPDQKRGLVWSVASYTKKIKASKKQVVNVLDFMDWLLKTNDSDCAVVLVMQVLQPVIGGITGASVIMANSAVANILAEGKTKGSIWYTELVKRNALYELTKKSLEST